MNIQSAFFTNSGGREVNEDSLGSFNNMQKQYFYVVADGLGGHGDGEIASKTAVDISEKKFLENNYSNGAELIKTSFEEAQKEIMDLQKIKHNRNGMKTTGVLLYIDENEVVWGHIGDSRLYAFKKNKIKVRTLDHSVPQMLVAAKEIKEKNIRRHPDRNKLLNVLGTQWENPKYEISQKYKALSFDAFLLCSDGFWELIDEKKMQKYLKKANDPQSWIDMMVDEVVKNSIIEEMDNYTAIAIWMNR